MNENPKVDHAMMSFALMGGLLVTPRSRPADKPAPQLQTTPPTPQKKRWFLA